MIHSLSGGVIADNTELLYAKVEVEGAPSWYISPFSEIKEGDRVLVPYGRTERITEGKVLRTERVNRQTAPYPVNRTREILQVL